MCGNACPGKPNGTAVCASGTCNVVCSGLYKDCNFQPGDGCEVNSGTDVNNCGACGKVCGAVTNGTPACTNGACGVGQCNANWGNCDGMAGNGCETNLLTANANCGVCGNACPAGQSCANGVCTGATYYPSGVQQNVPPWTLVGWTLCYQDTYNLNMAQALPTILANCSKAKILMACKQTSATNLQVLAAAPRTDVFTDVGTGNTVTTSNGVAWYYDDQSSWGFAPAGQTVNRAQCDINAGADRLCWHTLPLGIGGYRCGNNVNLNNATDWQRFVYHAN
jgi:hypothetical protein